jgi:MFS family permease
MVVALYLTVVALFTLSTGITYPVLILFAASVGVGATAYGVVTGFGLSANAAGRPLAGRLSDRLGRKGFLVIGLVLLLIANVIYAITPRNGAFAVLAVAKILVGLGAGLFWPVLNATVVEALPKQQRERPLGLVTATQSGSIAVGAAIGGIVADLLGYRWTFIVAASFLGAALVLTIYLSRRRAAEAMPHRDPMPKGHLTTAAISPAIAFFLLNIAIGAIVTFLPLYAHVEFRSTTESIGLVFTVVLLARAGGSLLVSLIARRGTMGGARRSRLVAVELVFAAAALAVTPAVGFAGLVVTQVLIALALGGGMVTLVAMVADAAPPSALGSAIGTVESGGFVGSLIGSVAGGVLFQAVPHLLFPLAGVITLGGAVSLIPVLRPTATLDDEVVAVHPGSGLNAEHAE